MCIYIYICIYTHICQAAEQVRRAWPAALELRLRPEEAVLYYINYMCVYACMFACMHACMHVCIYIYIHTHILVHYSILYRIISDHSIPYYFILQARRAPGQEARQLPVLL